MRIHFERIGHNGNIIRAEKPQKICMSRQHSSSDLQNRLDTGHSMQGRSDKRQDGRTGWMQERTDVVQDGSRTRRMQYRCKTGHMQDRMVAEQYGCRAGQMQDRMNAGQKQDRADAGLTDTGQDRCKTGRMQYAVWMQDRTDAGEEYQRL